MDVIVHGGAGSPPDAPAGRQAALDAAATAAAAEAEPLDAVEVACRVLEHDPQFNAGVGACVQSDGIPRTDAGVMTSDREVGAACAMPGVEHAVSVARIVHEETPHVLVGGVHAVDLAEAFDVPVEVDLFSEATRRRWADEDAPPRPVQVQVAWVDDRWGSDGADRDGGDDRGGGDGGDGAGGNGDASKPAGDPSTRGDTVGAVAREGNRIAAATSTGGRWGALAGRIGDVPQVGSGFFANEVAGASATGAGEDIARSTLSRRAVDQVADGADAQEAAETAIEEFGELAEGTAGIIVADAEGGLGSAFDSEAMATATARR